MTKIRPILLLLFVLFVSFVAKNHAQTPAPTPEIVTISRAAAVKCLETGDKLTASEAENKAKDAAINDLKAIISDLKAEFARVSGEKTQLEAARVRDAAIIDVLIRNYKARTKIGLVNF